MGPDRVEVESTMVKVGIQEMGRCHAETTKDGIMLSITRPNPVVVTLGQGHVLTLKKRKRKRIGNYFRNAK